jgi:hypothetical protein
MSENAVFRLSRSLEMPMGAARQPIDQSGQNLHSSCNEASTRYADSFCSFGPTVDVETVSGPSSAWIRRYAATAIGQSAPESHHFFCEAGPATPRGILKISLHLDNRFTSKRHVLGSADYRAPSKPMKVTNFEALTDLVLSRATLGSRLD